MGKKIVLSGVSITDTSAPKIVKYDRLESSGSLFLAEVAHPTSSWAAGVPSAGNTAIQNILWEAAAAMLGSGDATTLAGILTVGTNWSGAGRKLERTTKGGLHGVIPNPLGTASAQTYFAVKPPDAVCTYMLNNSAHDFYVSLWGRVTRRSSAASGVAPAVSELSNTTGPGVNYLTQMRAFGNLPAVGRDIAGSGTNPVHANVHAAAWSGTKPTLANMSRNVAIVGPQGINGSSSTPNNTFDILPSFIFYRAYIEDLTVSGRTYAQVDAIDAAAFASEVNTSGGRYFGDGYTDPATV